MLARNTIRVVAFYLNRQVGIFLSPSTCRRSISFLVGFSSYSVPRMRPFKRLVPSLRTAVAATSGFIAGGFIESRFPFFEKVQMSIDKLDINSRIPTKEQVSETKREELRLPYLTDKVFETTDDMLVFMFPSEEVYQKQASRVMGIVDSVTRQQEQGKLKRVKMLFTIVPHRGDAITVDDNKEVEIMCYKGQRKQRVSLKPEDSISVDSLEDFFRFRSTPVDEELKSCVIEHVSGDEFDDRVIASSSREKPVLLQLYEKSCFLCFLMRPFLNSLATILNSDPAVPFTIKRLDIEENDFPEKLPVVRGTPTFILFRGTEADPERLEEFKPRDLAKRITRDYLVSRDTQDKVSELVDKMTLRFQLFSGLVMWNTESEKILQLISGDHQQNPTIPFDLNHSEDKDKEVFNRLVSEYMAEDMLKVDTLDRNLQSVSRELTQMEKHAIMMGQVLGEKVLVLESIEEKM